MFLERFVCVHNFKDRDLNQLSLSVVKEKEFKSDGIFPFAPRRCVTCTCS